MIPGVGPICLVHRSIREEEFTLRVLSYGISLSPMDFFDL